jgi:hypothetical protein
MHAAGYCCRGSDLCCSLQDEQLTIDVFKKNTPSVVYIENLALRSISTIIPHARKALSSIPCLRFNLQPRGAPARQCGGRAWHLGGKIIINLGAPL